MDELSWGQWEDIRTFDATTRYFALSLRELHKYIRIGSDPLFDEQDVKKLNAGNEAISLIPLFIDQAFIYIRRLADQFLRASRYVLFKNTKSVALKYDRFEKFVVNQKNLEMLAPICDVGRLKTMFSTHSGWFDKVHDLADENGEVQKGVRDIMEHYSAYVTVQQSKVNEEPWEVIGNLGVPYLKATFRYDLTSTLKEIVGGLTGLWTEVCAVARLQQVERLWIAPYGDAVLLTGNDDDSTGFWPEI
jgi:hypothetical protein